MKQLMLGPRTVPYEFAEMAVCRMKQRCES